VAQKDRIFNLDMLRGWAILGILAVNAMAFAWPLALTMGEMSGVAPPYPHDAANIRGDWVTDVFFEDKFRSLFSMLFGVSIFLIGGERDSERGPVLVRRLMWLGLFGLVHGAVFWAGDILLHYAYCGLIVMLARSWSARRLIWTGAGLNAAFAVLSALAMLGMGAMQGDGAAGADGNPFAMTRAQVTAAIAAYQGGGLQPMIENLKAWLTMQSASLFLIPITSGLMMLGLGLFKAGFFSGRSPTWLYGLLVLIGAANLAGFAWYGWLDAATAPTQPDASRGLGGVMGSFAPLVTLGYASLLILLAKVARPAVAWLAPVGRMAFTNYLTQTLVMASLFHLPWGPGWFGDPAWGPGRLWLIVVAIWVAQIIWSPLWLSRFQFGPFEWVWRRLTYGRPIALRRQAEAAAVAG